MSEQGVPPTGAAPINVADEPFDVTPPAADSAPDEAPAARSKARIVVLSVLLAVVLLVVGAVGLAGLRITRQKDATLLTPDEIAALRRDTSSQAVATADYLSTALAAEVDLDDSIGAVYTDPASGGPAVLLFGGTTLFWTPESDLATAFELLSDDAGTVKDIKGYPAGDLGGVLKCGDASQDGPMAVCGWADHGSIALAMFPGRTPDLAAPLMRDVRQAILRRS